MKPQLKLILKLMFVIISCLILTFGLVMPQYSNEYMASLRDKYARIRAIDEPKIILVGGSNVAFGFDSELLEKEMAMPVVNFGVHANLTQAFPVDIIKKHIKPGDIVILAPEYYDYTDQDCDYVLAWLAIEDDIPLLRAAAGAGHLDGLLTAFPTYFRRAMNRFFSRFLEVNEIELTREEFNAWGDYDILRPERVVKVGETNSFMSASLSDFLCDYWNGLNDFIHKKGASLYMSCPPIALEQLDVDLVSIQNELETKLNFPVISKLTDYVYPIDYFYDTGFHLNDHGRVLRTRQLVSDLKGI